MFESVQRMIEPNRKTTLIFAVIVVLTLLFVTVGLCQDILSVSIPYSSLVLQDGERVGGFEVSISGGEISSFPNVPAGWGVCIDNEPNQTAHVGGNATVGSAFLQPSFFNDFISIKTKYGDPKSLNIRIKMATMTNITLKERDFDLEMKDLVLKKVKEVN